jgi:hypothetical protein
VVLVTVMVYVVLVTGIITTAVKMVVGKTRLVQSESVQLLCQDNSAQDSVICCDYFIFYSKTKEP